MEVKVRNKFNAPIGYCREAGAVVNAFHIRKGYQGFYNKVSDITFDKDGKVFCYGDGTQTLIHFAEANVRI